MWIQSYDWKPDQKIWIVYSHWASPMTSGEIRLLFEQTGKRISSSTSHLEPNEIARQRSDRTYFPKFWASRRPEIKKIMKIWNLQKLNILERPCTRSFSAPIQWIDLKFSMRLDNINISQLLNAHSKRTCRKNLMLQKPSKNHILFRPKSTAKLPAGDQ